MTTLTCSIIAGIAGLCAGLLLHWIAQLILAGDDTVCCAKPSQTKIFALLICPLLSILIIHMIPLPYVSATLFFISALLIATITDMQALVISRFTSLFLVPIGWVFAFFNFLPISFLASIAGSIFGYAILYITARIFYVVSKKDGLGSGDYELLAYIGTFTGITGVWLSLLIGCLFGSIIGLGLLAIGKTTRTTLIPFGPFLALGAVIYLLYGHALIKLLLYSC